MPELPEVETIARTLLPHIQNHDIIGAQLLRESALHPLSLPLTKCAGSVIRACRRRGKLLLLDLDGMAPNAVLVAHLRMTGRMLHKDLHAQIHKHTRCVFDLAGPDGAKSRLFFDDMRSFGQLLLATPDILRQWPFWRELGPEPLQMDAPELATRLQGTRPIKTALMDQKVVAGLGNIYADESLFAAGISPLRAANSLSATECSALLASIQAILRLSISQCGSSIKDYRDADGNAGAFQNSFAAYGRGGKPCQKCGAPMRKTRLAGRSTVYCANCQK